MKWNSSCNIWMDNIWSRTVRTYWKCFNINCNQKELEKRRI